MANKMNANIAIDRAAVESAANFAASCAKYLESLRQVIAKHVQYLTKEENISGAETIEFKQAVSTAGKTVGIVSQKMDCIAKGFNKLLIAYGGQAITAKRKFEDAKNDMDKVITAMKDIKK